MEAIILCNEKERAPFFSVLWRLQKGWRWVPLPLRGPSEPFGVVFTLLGVWQFAREPRRMSNVSEEAYKGAKVLRLCPYLGSYGMGGPGFWGLKCKLGGQQFWIVYRLWSADSWITLDGKFLKSSLMDDELADIQPERLIDSESLLGAVVESFEVDQDKALLTLTDREGEFRYVELRSDGSTILPWRGNGEKKVFLEEESLEDGVILSRRANLWTTD